MKEEKLKTLNDIYTLDLSGAIIDRICYPYDLRREAIKWVRAFIGNGEQIGWEDIIDIKRIKLYASDCELDDENWSIENWRTKLAVTWGVEEGAIAMLMTFFDIKEEELK